MNLRYKDAALMTIAEMVRGYFLSPGMDDAIDPELERRGADAREELIAMIEAIPDRERRRQKARAIVTMLSGPLQSIESYEALERWFSRDPDPSAGRATLTALRLRLSGKAYEEFRAARAEGGTYYENLRYVEALLGVAREKDRLSYLIEVAGVALDAARTAKEQKIPHLESKHRAKARQYAEEILAIPNLATESGDGVYYGNHVLGLLALDGGDTATATRHLLEAAKASPNTPGSEMLTSFGPHWELAAGLLERGERESVCEYLNECKKFVNDKLIDAWILSIRAGKVPDLNRDWRRKGSVKGARK